MCISVLPDQSLRCLSEIFMSSKLDIWQRAGSYAIEQIRNLTKYPFCLGAAQLLLFRNDFEAHFLCFDKKNKKSE